MGIPETRREPAAVEPIGKRRWAIADGYIPGESTGATRQLKSHETACILNAGARDAHVSILVFYADREPEGPHRVVVPARRTLHVRFNELGVAADTDYAALLESDVPVVVQHTRLDSRQAELALLSTVAYASD